jgi:anti-sigma regulatory factor (Ser/Thr protein kinase)
MISRPAPSDVECNELQVSVPRWAGAPKVARARVRDWCESCELPDSNCETVLLLLSEVVMNAVMHADAPRENPIRIAAKLDDRLHVAVTDSGCTFPRQADPARRGGFGMGIIDRAADRWGIERDGGTRVWFDVPVAAG